MWRTLEQLKDNWFAKFQYFDQNAAVSKTFYDSLNDKFMIGCVLNVYALGGFLKQNMNDVILKTQNITVEADIVINLIILYNVYSFQCLCL